jgi:carboxyl-terminal processing protease
MRGRLTGILGTARRLSPLLGIISLLSLIVAEPAAADKRIALVVGNAAYRNVTRLDNASNDAKLMADTLRGLGFTLVGGGAQLDLDKPNFDRMVQSFGNQLMGADVALFYYAGHGVQVRGANYLVPVDANPVREADVDFQMLETNLLLRQMEGSGTKLNLLILDACRNNPFGGRGLRSTDAGLAQMRAPEGTLISFATQPGNVALDGADGNSPYTKALAQTIKRSGLGIFEAFNEVGLAVKRATGGAQLPWVSNSPIDGSFYFAPTANVAVAPAPVAATRDSAAGQVWTATRETTSLAVIEAYIQQYGDTIYGALARARRDELKKNQVAVAAPAPAPAPLAAAKGGVQAPPPGDNKPSAPKMARADVAKLFASFGTAMDRVRSAYIEPPNDGKLYAGAIDGMRKAFPATRKLSTADPAASSAASPPASPQSTLNNVYDVAAEILSENRMDGDAGRVVGAAIGGAVSSLDPHSNYLDAKAYSDTQIQSRGTFVGVGMEVTLENGLLKVVSPIDGTPAAKAGVLANDIVTHVDDVPILGLALNQAVDKLRGAVNTNVKVRITRKGQDNPVELVITRDSIRVRSVRSRVEGDDLGYVRITTFNETTTEIFKQAIDEVTTQITKDKIKGFIIDLRNNPGGLHDQVVAVADEVLERGEIVSTRTRDPKDAQRFNARAGDATNGKPIVVLINGGTAAGAEILAGALQDNKRATLIGTRSFGKGTVQTIIPLGADKGALRLTTARYYTPSGRSIQARGIDPDVEILQDVPEAAKATADTKGEAALPGHLAAQGVEQSGSQSYVPPNAKDDKALRRAIELLHTPRP